jgi:thymidine phosphorylase
VGLAVVELGGGRKKTSDSIDHSVGLTSVLGLGEKVKAGQPLAIVHAQNQDQANIAINMVNDAYTILDISPSNNQTIIKLLK